MTTNSLQSVMNGAIAGSLIFSAFMLLFMLGLIALWLVGLIHCIKHKHDNDRLMWVLIVLLGGPVGSLLYWTMARSRSSTPAATAVPPVLQTSAPKSGSVWAARPNPSFDHAALHDEKKRAASINDALLEMAASKRRGKGK